MRVTLSLHQKAVKKASWETSYKQAKMCACVQARKDGWCSPTGPILVLSNPGAVGQVQAEIRFQLTCNSVAGTQRGQLHNGSWPGH